jgi:hypothetical protein
MKHPLSQWGLFALFLAILYVACTPEPEYTRVIPNQAPETAIQGAPLDSSNAFHRYHVYWIGLDPDGEVVEYGVAVTDSNIAPDFADYRRTTKTDTIIDFVANNEVVLSHAIWVFAVDNEGERDATPDRKFFNAVDYNRPVPVITSAVKTVGSVTGDLAVNDTLPSEDSSVHFTWRADDADLGGTIRAFRIKLSTENSFTEIPAESTGVTYTDLPSGNYEFLVEAIDNAGAESLDPARFPWVVNFEPDTRILRMVVAGQDVPMLGQGPWATCGWPPEVPTIRDSSRVTFVYEENDQDGSVQEFSYRVFRTDITRCAVLRGAFSTWFPETAVSLPPARPGSEDTTTFFTSNDYEVIIRSRDNEEKPDGTPPGVKFRVNFPPILRESALFPGPGAVIDSSATAVNDSLDIRFAADDTETPPSQMSYRVVLDGRFGLVTGPVPADSLLFERWPFPRPGQHTLQYTARDPGSRADTLVVTFTVVP